MQKIVLTGGGSCGHILPSIALLPELKKHFDKIYYFGENDSLEQSIAKENNLEFFHTKAIKLTRGSILKNLAIPFVLPKAIYDARLLLKKLSPDVVFSKGGYVSLPTTIAAQLLGIPVVVHESDNTLGVANKLASYTAKRVIMPNTHANKCEKYVQISNPLRAKILTGNARKVIIEQQLRINFQNILIIGGSLGASSINDVIMSEITELTAKYNIIHLTGKGKISDMKTEGYYPLEYASNIEDYYAVADLVISRAGAGVIAELKALGKRAILIPLPDSCSRGDQKINAADSGYLVMDQNDLDATSLLHNIACVIDSECPESNYDYATPKKIVDVIITAKNMRVNSPNNTAKY